ncbi:MAG: endonuclease/exonuclease/phosphatase family protein [Pirellulales bacterium]|nr:endonuclease/exonuclease/phosphatase family protein [Pirellulales bacterium]
MQRLLSMATLAVLGGMAFLFLREGDFAPGAGQGPIPAPTAQQSAPGGAPFGTIPASTNPFGTNPFGTPSGAQSGGFAGQSIPATIPVTTPPPAINAPGAQPASVFRPVSSTPVVPPTTGPTIRIASFNIQVFGKTKASKPYVMYTLAEIVRQFDVVAIQEIRTQDDYHIPNFVKLINEGGGTPRRYDHLVGPRLGNTTSTEQYAFLYDAERILLDPNGHYTVRDPDNLLHREPLVARFATRMNPNEAFTFTLINVHTDPDVVPQEMEALAEVYRVVRRAGGDEDDVIMLGDFNTDDKRLGRLGQFPGIQPLISGVFTNMRQTKLYDNIIVHQPSTSEYTGRSGVFDVMRYFNLTLEQAEQVSDHLPVWAEFTAYERDYTGRVAYRGTVAR